MPKIGLQKTSELQEWVVTGSYDYGSGAGFQKKHATTHIRSLFAREKMDSQKRKEKGGGGSGKPQIYQVIVLNSWHSFWDLTHSLGSLMQNDNLLGTGWISLPRKPREGVINSVIRCCFRNAYRPKDPFFLLSGLIWRHLDV